ncbi:MAG TPA: transporter [Desulfobacteraceae bacterium]|nr:transporter [Desulfobacteraceae bacterium]
MNLLKPKGPLHTGGGNVFDVGEYQLLLRYVNFKQDQLYDGTSKTNYSAPGPYERTTENYQLAFRAGIIRNVDLRVIAPVLGREMKRKTKRDDLTQNNFGLGDIRLIGRYRLLAQNKGDNFNMAVGLGIKMPTGNTNEHKDGELLPGYLQPGTGSWDPILELAAHRGAGRHRYGAHLIYRLSTGGERGEQDFECPDDFQYNMAYVYGLSRHLDIFMEMNGRYMTKAKLAGITQENTGGHTIHLTPGFNIKFTPKMHISLGVPIMAYRDLNGEQLSEDYRISTKLVYKF